MTDREYKCLVDVFVVAYTRYLHVLYLSVLLGFLLTDLGPRLAALCLATCWLSSCSS